MSPSGPKNGEFCPDAAINLGGELRSSVASQTCVRLPDGCVENTTSLPSFERSYSSMENPGATRSLLPDSRSVLQSSIRASGDSRLRQKMVAPSWENLG